MNPEKRNGKLIETIKSMKMKINEGFYLILRIGEKSPPRVSPSTVEPPLSSLKCLQILSY